MNYDSKYTGNECGETFIHTGYISIYPKATKSLNLFKATIIHEYSHAKIDRYLSSEGYDWLYKPKIKFINDTLIMPGLKGYRLDGTCGYGNEIINAGRMHITLGYFLNPTNNDLFPKWLITRGWKEWYYLLPTRFNNGITIKPY